MAQVATANRLSSPMLDKLSATTKSTSEQLRQVPDLSKMALSSTLQSNAKKLSKVQLQQVNCSFDVVRPEGEMLRLKNVVKQQAKNNGADVTIMYAIRQPACPSNREHALQLSEFAKNDRRLALVGTQRDGQGG
mmetsp:Transcript_4866/g.10093  ORF Transcript_4866/g.10093 Transcript_4866/m.10093 type:complete len:134 (-) Transcript_4866:731-1132(-)